ncbi:MAG TPA: hypothetical protein VGI39_11545 [Polyangiaceae bacterium]|jgi:hypothetical protein
MENGVRAHGLRVALVAGVIASCEAPAAAVRQYAGTSVTLSAPVAKGGVSITSANGAVWVDSAGTTGSVSVTGRAFASGPDDGAAIVAAAAAATQIPLTVASDGQGGVTVVAGGDSTKGYDLTVHLPYPFDGLLTIQAKNGYVHYVGTSGAKGASITVGNGDVFAQDAGAHLTITGGTSNIDVITLPTLAGDRISTQNGDISAQIPNAAVLLITADARSGGTVTPPPDKSVQTSDTGDDDDGSRGTAISTVAEDHAHATIQLGTMTAIQSLGQYLTVQTGHGNIVFH